MGKTQEENLNLLKSMYLKLKHLGYRHTHINARTHTRKTQPRSQKHTNAQTMQTNLV